MRGHGCCVGRWNLGAIFFDACVSIAYSQDPRYFRKGEGSGWSRAGYSIPRGFLTRSDSGKTQANWSNALRKFVGAGLSNLYHPQADRGASLTLSRVAISLSYQMFGNLAIEFRPEIHRKVFGQKQGSQIPTPAMRRSVRIKVAFRPSTSPFFELMTTEPALPFDDGSPADRYLSEMISCATSSPHMPYTVPAVHAPTE